VIKTTTTTTETAIVSVIGTATVIEIETVTATATAGPDIATTALSDLAAANPTVLALPVASQTATGERRRLQRTHMFLAPPDLEVDPQQSSGVVRAPAAPAAIDTEMTIDIRPRMTDTGSAIATTTGLVPPSHVEATLLAMTTEGSLVLPAPLL